VYILKIAESFFMFDHSNTPDFAKLPHGVSVGYKPQHFSEIMASDGAVDWLEVHAENYMGDGGRPLAQLEALGAKYPLSIHGVGLSIGLGSAA